MNVGKCKGCDKTAELVKSHLIPESFVRATDDGSGAPIEVTDVVGIFPKRRPIGHYDANILCIDCESKLSIADDYGYELFCKRSDQHVPHKRDGSILYYTVEDVDSVLLHRFLVSMLWRFSISTIPFANLIALGPHEEQARKISIDHVQAINRHSFSYMISRFMPSSKSSMTINPHMVKWNNINYAKILMPEYQAWIKVDSQTTHSDMEMFMPSSNNKLTIIAREMDGSPELKLMQHLAR